MNVVRRALIAQIALTLTSHSAASAQDQRLSARLDKPTLGAVSAIVDSARIAKLPTAPLVDKALEGSAKGSDGSNITSAVHLLFVRMGSAKKAIGPTATADEIKSASDALDAGVSVRDLARLRAAAGKRPVTMAACSALRFDPSKGSDFDGNRLGRSARAIRRQRHGFRSLQPKRARRYRPRRRSDCRRDDQSPAD